MTIAALFKRRSQEVLPTHIRQFIDAMEELESEHIYGAHDTSPLCTYGWPIEPVALHAIIVKPFKAKDIQCEICKRLRLEYTLLFV